VTTGQGGVKGAKPFFRAYGPDLTGLFVHDSGALGVKTSATLRMIRAPRETGYVTFGFETAQAAISAACEVSRAELAEEAYIMDPAKTRLALAGGTLRSDVKTLAAVTREAGGGLKGARAGIELVRAGKHFADDVHSLNIVCAARSKAALEADVAELNAIAAQFGGRSLPDSIPRANRANLFLPLNGVLGPQGDRWVALNAKVAHSDAQALYDAAEAILERRREETDRHGVTVSRLLTMMSNHVFSYEPVFNWFDSWLPQHRRAPEPRHLAKFTEPPPNLEARALVTQLRTEMVELFAAMGAASNQIGKTYRYFASLKPETRALVAALKKDVDEHGLMNPGALGL
jgi:FAD/FMN-containing dehydrogenase